MLEKIFDDYVNCSKNSPEKLNKSIDKIKITNDISNYFKNY